MRDANFSGRTVGGWKDEYCKWWKMAGEHLRTELFGLAFSLLAVVPLHFASLISSQWADGILWSQTGSDRDRYWRARPTSVCWRLRLAPQLQKSRCHAQRCPAAALMKHTTVPLICSVNALLPTFDL
ncbi:MAG: hypothetical protein ACK4P4_00540 [Allorhizobium sp.]